ncbi:MAG: histidine kinase [Pyrinomonadaceae bacterium]|nr:histidine kinase [Pyrinomonadaceae bacterium]
MFLGALQKRFSKRAAASAAWATLVLFLSVIAEAERLPVKTYTVADGLLRDYVYKIKQDSRGFLWFCTPGGVSRFDGYAFTNFAAADGLPDRRVNDFLETQNGTIWLATDAGLAKLNPTGIRNPQSANQNQGNLLFSVYLPENPKAKKILVLFEDENGQIFAGTNDGLYRLVERNGDFELESVDLGKPLTETPEITSIIKDRRGALWIGTNLNGLIRLLPDGQAERFMMENGLPGNNIESLLEDKNGRIWVGMRAGLGAGLSLLVNSPEKNQKIVERIFTTKDGLPADWITALHQSSDGQVWVATIRGLCRWQGDGGNSVCKTYTAKNDICDSDIWALTEDKDGNLWMGTRCGAKKLARYGFTTYSETDGVESTFINSIFENSAGELFATSNSGETRNISRFNGETFDLVKPNFPPEIGYFGWGTKQTVRQDRAGDWWFPTGNGLYGFPRTALFEDLSKITPQRFAPVAERIEIFRLFEDSHGDFWCATTGTKSGFWRWEKTKNVWHDHTKDLDFFGKDRLGWAFVEDTAGNLWISTGGETSAPSLIRYRNGQFRIFTEADGVMPGIMQDLFVDGKGHLWLANSVSGLLRLDDVNAEQLNFTRYSITEGLSTSGAVCVTQDEFGRIYACTARGLDRLTPESGQIENFTTADGLPNSYPQMAHCDRTGALWFGTTDGVARFQPEPKRQRKPPNILIIGLRIGGETQNISILGEREISALELDADRRQISVDFVGLGATLGEKLKYEYRFGDADWTQTNERTINFANLGSGDYQFEIRAVTADRIYSQNPATLSFKIAAPLWQRRWFLVLIAVLIAGLIYLFYRNRLARLLEMERMRTRIATDLHDDIGANLTKIAILSEVAQQRLGQNSGVNGSNGKDNLLGSVAEISRESVSAMGDIVWAINPKKDSLIGLTRRMRQYAEEILEQRSINLEFDAPTPAPDLRLDANIRRNVYLIFKESVNNIVRHSNAAAVKIDFRLIEKELVLQIGDDGDGFDTAQEYDGNGLLNIKKRAADCAGRLEIESLEGAGTKIVLHLKLKSAAWSWR